MSAEFMEDDMLARARQWREAFDQSFAAAPLEAEGASDDYLAISVGSMGYALRLADVAGLQVLGSLTPCPSARRELLGLCSFRGSVLPVYDLRVLLGASAGQQQGRAWWVVAKDAPLGLAFDVFERHLRLPAGACSQASAGDTRQYAAETLRCDGQLRPVVSVAAILADIRDMVQ